MSELKPGREPVTYVEIEQDICTCYYTGSRCFTTGSQKSYATNATCGDRENLFELNPEPLTLRFTMPHTGNEPGIYAIPSVIKVTTAPTVINPGGGGRRSGPLGQRSSLKVTFQDHPGSDNVVDPFLADRGFNPMNRGTWWGKWIARNPYYNNRVIRVREGYRGQDLNEMVTRTYLMERIEGPDSNGRVTISAKDILRLADDDKAQAPKPSTGELMIDYGKDDAITMLRVTRADAADYPANGTVRINRELLTYTTVTTIGPDEIRLNGITRATDGTEARGHKAGDRVQWCLRYTNVRVDALAYEWLVTYAGIPTEYIDYPAWQAEAALWLDQFDLTGIITEPTGITKLLGEISEQCLFHIWWDERAQKIRFEALKPPLFDDVPEINDDKNIVADSVKIKDDPSSRASQVWVFWGQRDPTERLDNDANYQRIRVRSDLEAEMPTQYDDQRIRKIYSRWLHSEGQVINVSTRLLNRYRDTPKIITLDLDAKDRALWTGDLVDVTTRGLTDFTGLPARTRCQIMSAEEIDPGHRVRYEIEIYEFVIGALFGQWMESDAPTFEDATPEERLTGMWWSEIDGKMPDGSDGYTWI